MSKCAVKNRPSSNRHWQLRSRECRITVGLLQAPVESGGRIQGSPMRLRPLRSVHDSRRQHLGFTSLLHTND